MRPVLFTLALLGMAYTAYVHDVLAGIFAGASGVLLYLYLRERETLADFIYIHACEALGVTPWDEKNTLGDSDDE